MPGKKIKDLLTSIKYSQLRGNTATVVSGLAYDSRAIKPGWAYFALTGTHSDGHEFIQQALDKGASAIFHSAPWSASQKQAAFIRVEDTRKAMSAAAAAFYDFPARQLTIIGVTGTDGKSSTVAYIHQLLTLCGANSGFISTVNVGMADTYQKNTLRQSTPEAVYTHKILREMADNSISYCVLEATSHGLSALTSRLADIDFNAAVLTNVTHEHLEFHGTVEQYRADKANLFRKLKDNPASFGVVNFDEPYHQLFAQAAGGKAVYSYSLKSNQADLCSRVIIPVNEGKLFGSDVIFSCAGQDHKTFVPFPGEFNIANTMAAVLTVKHLTGRDTGFLLQLVPQLKAVPGRMQVVDCAQAFRVIVDYAHTPESFEKIFALLRPLTKGRLITVFGSAGERDIKKRPLQGEVASHFADYVVLTDEDPRGEDGLKILKEIAAGCRGLADGEHLFLEPDRTRALALALGLAHSAEDTVICLGKGHEQTIIYADGPRPWDEVQVIEYLLTGRL